MLGASIVRFVMLFSQKWNGRLMGWWELSLSTHSIGTHLKNGNAATRKQPQEQAKQNHARKSKQSDGFLDSATSLALIH
jgi:hypothetical protein